jgi:hypothetical protein
MITVTTTVSVFSQDHASLESRAGRTNVSVDDRRRMNDRKRWCTRGLNGRYTGGDNSAREVHRVRVAPDG